jgi:hypothetical protein
MGQVDFLASSDFLHEVTPMLRAPARPAESWDAAARCSGAICHHWPVVDARLSLDRPPGPLLLSVVRFDTRRETWCAVLDGDPQALPEHAPEWNDVPVDYSEYRIETFLITAVDCAVRSAVTTVLRFRTA